MQVKTRKSLFIAILCGLIIQIINSVVHAQPSSSPATGISTLVSVTGAAVSDLFTGAMTYRLPIAAPPGRKGVQPNLAITYRSDSGNGFLGVGWDLEIPAIERSARKGVSYSGDGNGYILRMAGADIELVSIGNNEYRAKIENDFLKIVKNGQGGTQYWDVYDKTGLHYTFGKTKYGDADPRQFDPSHPDNVFKWALDRVEDPNGNYMTCSYWKDQSQVYLDQINYTGNTSGLQTTNYVKFYWEVRSDAPSMFTINFQVITAYRLKTIYMVANGSPYQGYKLTYNVASGHPYSASTERSLLTSVQQFGKDLTLDSPIGHTNGTITGGSFLPPISFTYQDSVTPLSGTFPANYDWTFSGSQGSGYSVQVGDFNGDGKNDLYLFNSGSGDNVIGQNNGDGTFTWHGIGIKGNGYASQLGDFYGNGKTDIYLFHSGTGDHIVGQINVDWTITWHSIGNQGVGYAAEPGDLNGDGKIDIYLFKSATGEHIVWLNSGDGIFPANYNWYYSGKGANYEAHLGDFNGDNQVDIYLFNPVAGDHIVWLNKGDQTGSFKDNHEWESGSGHGGQFNITYGVIGRYFVFLSDFNGDGKTDIYMFEPSSGTHIVWLGEGDGTFPPSYSWQLGGYTLSGTAGIFCTPIPFYCSLNYLNLTNVQLGDFNGDGRTDIFMFNTISNDRAVWLNNGDGTFSSARYSHNQNPNADVGFHRVASLGDYNGDGKSDIYVFNPDTSTHHVLLNQGLFPDLLASIYNGIGGSTTISYTPTQYANTQLPFPVQTVRSILHYGDDRGVPITTYTFEHGFYHIGERDFRGFNYVKESGPIGRNGEQKITETWFHQGNETAVLSENVALDDLKNYATVFTGYMKGKPYRIRVSDLSGKVYEETTTSYAPDADGAAPYFNPPQQVDTYIDNAEHIQAIYSYDHTNGNLLRQENYGDVTDSADDHTIDKTYNPNTTAWILSFPTSETIYAGIGTSGTKMSQAMFYYDEPYDETDYCTFPATAPSDQPPTKGNLTRIVRWLENGTNPETRMAVDPYGNVICTRDPKGYISKIMYDASKTFQRQTLNPLSHPITTEYYGVDGVAADKGLFGQVKSVTDANSATTVNEYDSFGRIAKITLPDGTWASTIYPYFGTVGQQHVLTSRSNGSSTLARFDGLGRTFLQKKDGPDYRPIATKTEYNATGTVEQVSLPYFDEGFLQPPAESPRFIGYVYDALGRVLQVNNPDLTTVKTCYDKGVTVVVDANGHRKRSTKDAFERLIKVEEYTDVFNSCTTETGTPYATTIYEYDVLGRLRFVKDANGNQIEMRYDSLGRKTFMHDPDMGEWTYTYEANGNLKTQTDAKNQTITFTYDELNRVRYKDYPTAGTHVVTYLYDDPLSENPIGRLTSMADVSGTTKYDYDKMGRTKKVTKNIDTVAYVTQYSYEEGRLHTITYPDNEVVGYTYDVTANLTEVRNNSNNTRYAFYSGYNAVGQVGNVSVGNNVTSSYTYHLPNNRLKTILTTNATGVNLLDLYYPYDGYDNVGNITRIIDNTPRPQQSPFDEFVSYAYGINGSKPHAVARNLTTGTDYTYDANGNMTFDGTRTINYNYDNRPQSITVGGVTTTFVYDGSGERVKKITQNGTTIYVGKHYECKDGICVKYIFAGNTRIAHKISGTSKIVYFHQDHLGSTNAISDELGKKIEDIQYFPFGETRFDTGSTDVSMSYKYTSKELDETGLYYYGARYYNPGLGRFISADIIVQDYSDPQALNRYSYVLNNPLNYIDPTGYGFRKWYKKNRDRIKAAVVFVATAVATWECGGCGAASMLKGALVGEAFGVYSAHRTGASYFTSVFQGGVSGAAIAGAFGGVHTLTKGMNPLIQIGSKGFVGGTASTLLGGKFKTGFMYAAAAATLYWGYTEMMKVEPTLSPGEKNLAGGTYNAMLNDGRPPEGYNVVGLNRPEAGNIWDVLRQGEPVSNAANQIPGINAVAKLHDYWMNNMIEPGFAANVMTMAPAAFVTYGGLLSGPLSPLLYHGELYDSD